MSTEKKTQEKGNKSQKITKSLDVNPKSYELENLVNKTSNNPKIVDLTLFSSFFLGE